MDEENLDSGTMNLILEPKEGSANLTREPTPVLIKKDATSKKVMLCQVLNDPKLNFSGDSGAVGRLSVDSQSLKIDLKGRQYEGSIRAGPTVILLNLAPPVGLGREKDKNGASSVVPARAEMITNEFVELTFTRDILSGLMGDFSGPAGGTDSDGQSVDSTSETDQATATKLSGNKKKGKSGVVISQVTNKKRKSASKHSKGVRKKKNR